MLFDSFKNKKGKNTRNLKEAKPVAQDQKEKKVVVSSNTRVPKDVAESIPYRSVYPNGIIEDYDNNFSKTYRIDDVNFSLESDEARQEIFLNYEKVLNTVSAGMVAQLTIFNRSVDIDTVRNNILMKPKDDSFNQLREEWNDLLLEKLQEGRNNLTKERLFTVSVHADNILEANEQFKNIDSDVSTGIYAITKRDTQPLSIEERLGILYDIYNLDNDFPFRKRIQPVLKNGSIDFPGLAKYGVNSKDLIACDSMDFPAFSSKFYIGDAHCAAFYVDHLPNTLNTRILNDITSIPCNMLCSATYVPIDRGEALNLIDRENTEIAAQVKGQMEHGNSYITPELEQAQIQAKALSDDVRGRDQKVFKVTVLVVLMAKSDEELQMNIRALRSTLNGYSCHMRSMRNQEEVAFNTALPLAQMQVGLDRVLTTESGSVFQPFYVQEMNEPNGTYLGLNAESKTMIRYNRKGSDNYNSVIIGKSGSGKSFVTKEIIEQEFLTTEDRFIIIDPEGEYTDLGEALGASIITIDDKNEYHINPMDIDIEGDEGESPLIQKSDYVLSLFENMLNGVPLGPLHRTIVQRAVNNTYRSYFQYINKERATNPNLTIDKEAMPTLGNLYEELVKMKDPAAQELAIVLEPYATGAYRNFSYRTNVDVDARMIVYNVANMPQNLKELAMFVCMNDAWGHIIANGRNGIWTNFLVDEFHLFTKTMSSAKATQSIWKRARKFRGMPVAITQSIKDLLKNEYSEAIVDNSNFVLMMNQSPKDRELLTEMYSISPAVQDYITDRGRGIGLIYNGKNIIPFKNVFSKKDTLAFKLMESRVGKSKDDEINDNIKRA